MSTPETDQDYELTDVEIVEETEGNGGDDE